MSAPQLILTALPKIPLVRPGDDLTAIILDGLGAAELELRGGDVLVLASKIVSKAEGRIVTLDAVTPGERAVELAERTGKEAREIELILQESLELVRVRRGLIVTRHRLGFVCANAGVDHSNVEPGQGEAVLLLPQDPDGTARKIRKDLGLKTGVEVGVIIADSHGRPHRLGAVGIGIGSAGLPALEDWRGREDLFGYKLRYTDIGLADLLASAATLLLGQAREGTPIVHARGVVYAAGDGTARDLVRSKETDLFQ